MIVNTLTVFFHAHIRLEYFYTLQCGVVAIILARLNPAKNVNVFVRLFEMPEVHADVNKVWKALLGSLCRPVSMKWSFQNGVL